ncbi:chaperonin [Morganella morganii]|uniref:chaperonin n=1 Tax=Morganella morganii TaxID=582 RepID=UPI001A2BA2D8|nr:chaperonin [Vibrio vulnificus]
MGIISERLKNARIEKGFCVICGAFGLLSKDHVPPRCATTIQPMLQKTVSEYFSANDVIPINAIRGAVFKTICKNCNGNILGALDSEIKNPVHFFLDEIKKYLTGYYYNNIIKVPFKVEPFLKAMIGHLLAATSVESCKNKPIDSDFYTPLRQFVLGENKDITLSHDFYYWFYPKKIQITSQLISFYNDGHICLCSCMHFFPIAFLVTLKKEGTYPAQANKIALSDKNLYFDMSTSNLDYSSFPFGPLNGNKMMLFASGYTCVSYPQNK